MRPRPGWFQRTSASTETVSPVARSTIGWYWTTSSRCSIARSSSALRPWRRTIESRIAGVKTAKRRLPRLLGLVHGDVGVAQQLLGVRARVLAGGDADAEADVEQLLAGGDRQGEGLQGALGELDGAALDRRTGGGRGRRTRRRRGARRRRRRRRSASSREATPRSSSSPIAWPSVSLTPLKSSRSMNITATSPGAPGSSASRTCWLNSERLASPVSGSWWAWCCSWSCRSRSSETACSRRSYCSAALALAASVSNSARSASVKPRERPKRFASMIVPITRSSPRSTPSMPWRTPRSAR